MKKLVFGDTHGRRLWQRATADDDFDMVIFIGDYFDSWDVGAELQISNFKDIIAFKEDQEKKGKKVILIMGNHDFHYMKEADGEHYSGYNAGYASSIGYVLGENMHHLQVCYEEDGLLYSHAGFTKTWCEMYEVDPAHIMTVNELFKTDPQAFRFLGWDPSGDNKTQGPLWVRPPSLFSDMLDGYTQIVGHTSMKKINPSPNTMLWLIDAIEFNQYLEINDTKIEVKELPPLPKKPKFKHEDL